MNFNIIKLTYAGSLNEKNKVVTHVNWQASKSDNEGNTATINGITQLPTPEENFIEWNALTEELILDWLMLSIAESSKIEIENNLDKKLENFNQIHGEGLPWS